MTSGSKRLPTTTDTLLRNKRNSRELFGLNRLRNTTRTIQPPTKSTVGGSSTQGASAGNFLKTSGDTMIGALAFFPIDADIVNNTIDISPVGNNPPDYSTYVRLLPEAGTDDDLLTIFNATFSGQLLYLQGAQNQVISIIEGSAVNGGNILTNGAELFLIGDQFLELIFDPQADTGDPNVQGAWRVIGGGTGGFSSLLAGLSATVNPNLPAVGTFVIPWNENFILGQDKIQATATAGVFRLEDGVFDMSSTVSLEGDETGAGTNILMFWEEADLETGPWTGIPEPNARAGVYQIGRPSLSTQPHAVVIRDYSGVVKFVRLILNVLAGTLVNVFDATSFAQISTGGAGSGGGGGGSTTLAGLTDVILTNPVNTEVLTYNGNEWVNLPSAGGAMNTDLSNMIAPTLPPVDLNMNNNDIVGIDNMDMDGTGIISGLKILDFFQPDHFITSDSAGLDVDIGSLQEFLIRTPNGNIAKFDEINAGDRRLDMQENEMVNTSRLRFSPKFDIDISGFAQIYESLTDNDLRFVSQNTFTFSGLGTPTLLSIGLIAGGGGFLQDIGLMNFNAVTVASSSTDGDMELVFQSGSSGPADYFIFSGGQRRNISDVGAGGAGNSISQENTSVTVIDTGIGTITSNVDGSVKSILSATGLSMQTGINMGGNTISSVALLQPSGNHIRDIGGSTLFWREAFTDKITLQRTTNFIEGSSSGINYTAISTGLQIWDVGGTKMFLTANELTLDNGATLNLLFGMSSPIDMNGNSISAINDMDFLGTSSVLDMNGGQLLMGNGDIREVDDLAMRSGGAGRIDMNGGELDMENGDINAVNDLSMRTDGNGVIFMNGGILNMTGGDINSAGDVEIDGDLNHDGSRVGFYGTSPITKQTVNLTGTTTVTLVADVSSILRFLRDIGLINTNV